MNAHAIPKAAAHAFPSFALADLIGSGLYGRELCQALHQHFPDLPRAVVYEGIGLALTMIQADLILAEAQAAEAGRRLAELEAADG